MSPKNMNELKECANSIDQRLLKIGKIFTIRWVASVFVQKKLLGITSNLFCNILSRFVRWYDFGW